MTKDNSHEEQDNLDFCFKQKWQIMSDKRWQSWGVVFTASAAADWGFMTLLGVMT